MKVKYIRLNEKQLERIRDKKVHDRQPDHEIIELLLDTYDKYTMALDNDVS